MHHSVKDAMTSNPTTVEARTTVQEAARKMQSEDVGSLPIVEGERLISFVMPGADNDISFSSAGGPVT